MGAVPDKQERRLEHLEALRLEPARHKGVVYELPLPVKADASVGTAFSQVAETGFQNVENVGSGVFVEISHGQLPAPALRVKGVGNMEQTIHCGIPAVLSLPTPVLGRMVVNSQRKAVSCLRDELAQQDVPCSEPRNGNRRRMNQCKRIFPIDEAYVYSAGIG